MDTSVYYFVQTMINTDTSSTLKNKIPSVEIFGKQYQTKALYEHYDFFIVRTMRLFYLPEGEGRSNYTSFMIMYLIPKMK